MITTILITKKKTKASGLTTVPNHLFERSELPVLETKADHEAQLLMVSLWVVILWLDTV